MKEFKTLHVDQNYDFVEVNGQRGLKSKTMSIAIMPYDVDDNGMIKGVGFLKEYNPFRESDYAYTLITETIEKEDEDLLAAATRGLKEEGGIKVPEDEKHRWIYLGNFYPYKDSDRIIPTFAVDITGLSAEEPTGDGSVKEDKTEFSMIPLAESMNTEECLPIAAFLRLFNYFYAKTVANVKS